MLVTMNDKEILKLGTIPVSQMFVKNAYDKSTLQRQQNYRASFVNC